MKFIELFAGIGDLEMDLSKTILHLCCDEEIHSDSQPYIDAGYDVILVGENTGVQNFSPPDDVYGIIANPPCTMFSFARTTAKTPRDLRQGMFLVKECLRIIWECQYKIKSNHQKKAPLKFWVLENPYAMLKWFLGNPTLIYNPYDYGDEYQKKTALWGLFNIPAKNPIELNPALKELHKTNSQPLPKFDRLKSNGAVSRQRRRSICSAKFAEAFFKANK